MKKLLFIVVAFMLNAQFLAAQNNKPGSKAATISQQPMQKAVPVKLASQPVQVSNTKPADAANAPQNAPSKESSVSTQKGKKPDQNTTTQESKPMLKKDGTPDKRYKANQNLKKDGTPDKRFKENKASDAKK